MGLRADKQRAEKGDVSLLSQRNGRMALIVECRAKRIQPAAGPGRTLASREHSPVACGASSEGNYRAPPEGGAR